MDKTQIQIKKRSPLFYGALLIAVAAFWGMGNPTLKIIVEVLPPMYCNTIRFFLAFIIYMLIFGKKVLPLFKKEYIIPLNIIALFTTCAYATAGYSLKFTTAVNAGFFLSTAVIFTPILSYFMIKTKPKLKIIIPIIIVSVGIYFLCTANGTIELNIGDSIAILCAFFSAGMLVSIGKYVKYIDPLLVSVFQIGFTVVWSLVFAIIFETPPVYSEITSTIWLLLFFLVLFCTCFSYVIQNIALKHISPEYAAIIFSSEPVFGAIFSFMLLGELLNFRGVLGATIILASIILASLFSEEAT